MKYQKFGNTGLDISALGFGCMRFPQITDSNGVKHIDEEQTIPMLHRAYELGVNYFDTAFYYLDGESEVVVGKALKPFRDKINISTKIPFWGKDNDGTPDGYRRLLEKQLKKLDTDYIDYYHLWSTNRNTFDDIIFKNNVLSAALKAKEEGLIRHISFSYHGECKDIPYIIDKAECLETMLIQYNLLDRSYEEGIEYAASKGLGVVAMGPVGGGRLAAPSEAYKNLTGKNSDATYELALRFVLSNPNISCALSGMRSIEELEKNVVAVSDTTPFTAEERQKIFNSVEDLQKFNDLYCTGCGYCMPCPVGIDIPKLFYIYTLLNVYGLKDLARSSYRSYLAEGKEKGKPAPVSACVKCGKCEGHCPQKLKIREKLEFVSTQLEKLLED